MIGRNRCFLESQSRLRRIPAAKVEKSERFFQFGQELMNPSVDLSVKEKVLLHEDAVNTPILLKKRDSALVRCRGKGHRAYLAFNSGRPPATCDGVCQGSP